MNGLKTPKNKLRWHLLFPLISQLEEVVRVMEHGCDKYAENNWQQNVIENPLIYDDALFRHAVHYAKGEKKDQDSGRHPLAHVIACCLIIMWKEQCTS